MSFQGRHNSDVCIISYIQLSQNLQYQCCSCICICMVHLHYNYIVYHIHHIARISFSCVLHDLLMHGVQQDSIWFASGCTPTCTPYLFLLPVHGWCCTPTSCNRGQSECAHCTVGDSQEKTQTKWQVGALRFEPRAVVCGPLCRKPSCTTVYLVYPVVVQP